MEREYKTLGPHTYTVFGTRIVYIWMKVAFVKYCTLLPYIRAGALIKILCHIKINVIYYSSM